MTLIYWFQLGAGVGGCKVCNQSVFLAQRLLISGHLFHRTCFKCARCGALLSVANYYETQDGKYCCETCPDEERIILPSTENGNSSLVGNRKVLFETLAAADCTDDIKASKKAQRPSTLKMTDSIIEEKITSDDNDSGVIVSDKKEPNDLKTSASRSGSRETLSDPVVDESKEDCLVISENKIIIPSVESAINPIIANTLLDTNKLSPISLPDDLKQFNKEFIEDEIVGTKKNTQTLLSDDLNQDLERSHDNEFERQGESSEDLEIKTLSNKLLKIDYYESSKMVPVPSPRKKIISPIKTNYPKNLNPFDDQEDDNNKDKYSCMNPFGSDFEDEEEPVKKTNISLNPFSSDEDENEPLFQPPLPKPR